MDEENKVETEEVITETPVFGKDPKKTKKGGKASAKSKKVEVPGLNDEQQNMIVCQCESVIEQASSQSMSKMSKEQVGHVKKHIENWTAIKEWLNSVL